MGRENKQRLREFYRQQERQQCDDAIATPRPYWQDLHFSGVGLLYMRIVTIPSLEATECWEIRQRQELEIFLSQGLSENEGLVVGMTPLAIAHEELNTLLERFESLQLSPRIENNPKIGVLDGTRIVVRFEGGIQCSSQFQWVQGCCPKAWMSLESLILSSIDRFRAAEPHESVS
jgi:hypothetical protein